MSPITFWLSVTSTSVSSMVLASGFLLAMQPIPRLADKSFSWSQVCVFWAWPGPAGKVLWKFYSQSNTQLGRKGRITFLISNRKMLFSFREAALITSITLIFTLAAKLLRLQNSEIKRQKDDITNKFNVFYPPCATAQHNFLSWPHENSWAQDWSPGTPDNLRCQEDVLFLIQLNIWLSLSSSNCLTVV